ncbi:hypothetical protein C240_2219 [Enterococcus sp. 5H]|nr:hypothetical protein [Enterococcus sp. 5H]
MKLKPEIEIKAKTFFLEIVAGTVTANLRNNVVIENADWVQCKSTLKIIIVLA